MTILNIHTVPILKDNYAYLVECQGNAAIIDPGEAGPVIEALGTNNLRPSCVVLTHHHGDHTQGAERLAALYNIPVYGPAAERARIECITHGLKDGDVVPLSPGVGLKAIETPGHTSGALCYFLPAHHGAAPALLCGDTLFLSGCGRVFEGSAAQLWSSLRRLADLPAETRVYCGHEYALVNASFCAQADAENPMMLERLQELQKLRASGKPSVPGTIGQELQVNVFLRAPDPKIFAALRRQRDDFQMKNNP